jgi:hypothetical protein
MANIPSAKKPAIFLKDDMSHSHILSVAALYEFLKATNSKATVVAKQGNPSLQKLKALVPNLEVKHELPPKRFVVSIAKPDGDVENVQWQQDKDNLNIYITANAGDLSDSNVKLQAVGADYDLALLPAVKSLTELGDLFEKNKQFFKDTKLFAIGSDLNVDESYQHSSSNKPNLTTMSEQTYEAIESNAVNAKIAQLLFTGIIMETGNLRKDVKSSEIFNVMKKLADKGAKTTEVDRTVSQAQAGADAAASGKQSGNKEKDSSNNTDRDNNSSKQAEQSANNTSEQKNRNNR